MGPGLRRAELGLVGVTRGFALPWLCLLCFILQGIALICRVTFFSETRNTLRIKRRSSSSAEKFNPILDVRCRLRYCVRVRVRGGNLNALNSESSVTVTSTRPQASLSIPPSPDVQKEALSRQSFENIIISRVDQCRARCSWGLGALPQTHTHTDLHLRTHTAQHGRAK